LFYKDIINQKMKIITPFTLL